MCTEADKLNAEDKFAKALNDLRRIRPFYSALYESLERVENNSISTMGVSTRQMVYNREFIEKLSFAEFMFVNLHEIGHVALMHVSRRGNRNPEIWNIAADLYVNKLLANEFHTEPEKVDQSNPIKFLSGALYCSTVDLDKDSTEDIYESIMNNLKKQGFTNTDSDIGKEFEIEYTGNNMQVYSKYETFKQKIKVAGCADDILDNSSSSQTEKEDENNRILYEAKTRSDMQKSKMAGRQSSLMEKYVDEIIASHVDWRKLLRRYCIKATSNDSTFSSPDKRMLYQNAIYPGHYLEESNIIKGVKICFDSSGSISDTDIAHYFGQVKDLLSKFKIESEVLYWDTKVVSLGNIEKIKELIVHPVIGGGGTDPSCIYSYFDSKNCKVKPVVTLVFTDGYILSLEQNDSCYKWKKRYKDTIWVMTEDSNDNFNPPFGTVTYAKYSK
jgi:N4 gp25-like protein